MNILTAFFICAAAFLSQPSFASDFSFLVESDGTLTELSQPPGPPQPPIEAPTYSGYYFLGNTAYEEATFSHDNLLDALAFRANRYCHSINRPAGARMVRSVKVTASPAFLASVHPTDGSTIVVHEYRSYQGYLPSILGEVRCK